ncbi:hypothetical protein S83_008048, partial [Arachis hypogaea]
ILHFVENKTILITGATGFLAKIKVEKILVEKIQILQNEIIGKDLFRLLKENLGPNFNSFIAQKLTLVSEDISHQDLGLDSHSIFKQQIYHQTHAIINLATTTNVDERKMSTQDILSSCMSPSCTGFSREKFMVQVSEIEDMNIKALIRFGRKTVRSQDKWKSYEDPGRQVWIIFIGLFMVRLLWLIHLYV